MANLSFIGKDVADGRPTTRRCRCSPSRWPTCARPDAKLILIEGAARWCTPCNRDQPTMRNIEATYAPKGVITMEVLVEGGYRRRRDRRRHQPLGAAVSARRDHRHRSGVRARPIRRRDRVPRVHGGARVDDARRAPAGRVAGGVADRAGARPAAGAVRRALAAASPCAVARSPAARRRRARWRSQSTGRGRARERLHAPRSRRPAGAPVGLRRQGGAARLLGHLVRAVRRRAAAARAALPGAPGRRARGRSASPWTDRSRWRRWCRSRAATT